MRRKLILLLVLTLFLGGGVYFHAHSALAQSTLTDPSSALNANNPTPNGIVPAGKNNNYDPAGYGPCELITLVDNVLKFLIAIASVIAVVVFMYAGFLLVTSGGNASTVKRARSMFTNVVIGFVVMLSSYLIVNTILVVLAGGNTSSALLTWNSFPATMCVHENQVGTANYNITLSQSNPVIALAGTGNWSSSGTAMQSACDVTGINSDGSYSYDCSAQVAQCSSIAGASTVSTGGDSVTCSPSYGGVAGGQCNSNNSACSVSALQAAGLNATQANIMSCIAMTESSGIPTTPPYNVTHPGANSDACGTFQILQSTWNGVASGDCSNWSASCQDARCNAQVMASLVRQSSYSSWTCPGCNNKAQGCINKYGSS